MKDLGLTQPVIDAAKEFLRGLPVLKLPIGGIVQHLIDTYQKDGGFADSTADAADAVYLALRNLDRDGDGDIDDKEIEDRAAAANDLYVALQQNDSKGVQLKPSSMITTSTTSAVVHRAFDSLKRRVVVFTCWSSRGSEYAFQKNLPMIQLCKPDALMLHTDPVALTNAGEELNARILKECPWLLLTWATYGDSYGPDPSRIWARCAAAGEHARVETLMTDAEVSWKRVFRGATVAERGAVARRAVGAMRKAAPSLHLSLTSYDGPVSIKRPDGKGNWGGHGTFPWEGFEGEGSDIDAEASQVYIAASATPAGGAPYEAAMNRLGRYELSRAAAVKQGWIKKSMEPWMYEQAHGASPAAFCALAEKKRVTIAWPPADAEGQRGLHAACMLARMNLTVEEFQHQNGLKPDGIMGEKSLAAIGA